MNGKMSSGASSADLEQLRRLVFSVAYRMLGSVAEAEDIVQESFLRLHRAQSEGTEVDSPEAYLATVATRLSIDHLRSARVKRETYVGTWLPEPLVVSDEAEALTQAETAESLSMAFLLLLETLSPVERAVFLLREVFDYGYEQIAAIVGKSEDNCRQIFARSRRHIEAGRPRFEVSLQTRDDLAQRFLEACQHGSLDQLVQLLAADATFLSDGGGKATAVGAPLRGAKRIADFLVALFAKGARLGGRAKLSNVNGQPGAVLLDSQERVVAVMSFDIAGGRVQSIRAVVNPDKLQHVGPVSDLARLPDRPVPGQ